MISILVDIGNSSVKIAAAKGLNLIETGRYDGEDIISFIKEFSSRYVCDIVAVSSVRNGRERLGRELGKLFKIVCFADGKVDLPIGIGYLTPETLGQDRIAAAVGAYSLFPGEDLILFDFGTALTIDFIDKNGFFSGGNISPGLRMRMRGLHSDTEMLPEINSFEEVYGIGKTTPSAIKNGIILGMVYEAEGYIRRNPGRKILFTGGDSNYFAIKLKSPIFVVYNLVLIGLAVIADFNAGKLV